MKQEEREAIEESHKTNIREFQKAKENLNNYQRKFNHETERLANLVSYVNKDLSHNNARQFYDKFQEHSSEYRIELRKHEQQLEEQIQKENRNFKAKLNER